MEHEESGSLEPDLDVYETDTEFVIYAVLPGVDPRDIHAEATEQTLRLTAEHRPRMGKGSTDAPDASEPISHRRSRYAEHSRFSVTYQMPAEIEPDAIRAHFHHGLLTLHLPKRPRIARANARIKISHGEAPKAAPATPQEPQAAVSQARGQTPRTHEGKPTAKMGAAYTAGGGEDHTSQAQVVGTRIHSAGPEPAPRIEASSIAAGYTNPMEPPPKHEGA